MTIPPHCLNLYALPKLVDPHGMAGGTAVVIDVLRASTTICHALAAGAKEVLPCQEVDEARAAAANARDAEVVLGGERAGRPIPGFDLGNSPREYTPQRVGGKTLVFTTTNGTRAMARCSRAERVLIAAFVNAAAVVERLAGCPNVHVLCAGTDGQMSDDDILLGGLVVHRLQQRGDAAYRLNAQAITAWETWKHAFPLPLSLGAEPLPPARLAERLRTTAGARSLLEIGLGDDVLDAARLDSLAVVPAMDPKTMRIAALAR
ncbi:MAG: 2-phosphosulfolactate phosphatase [Pirellulales bacterium]|nr:2-phosphosulfolactate phosphatase [Pirellulales bacterium]